MGDTQRSELRISHELAVGLIVAVAGFSAWLTNTSYQIGSMKTKLETTIVSIESRLSAVEHMTAENKNRLDSSEGVR